MNDAIRRHWARDAARKTQCQGNLRIVWHGMRKYVEMHKHVPGNWPEIILPMLGEDCPAAPSSGGDKRPLLLTCPAANTNDEADAKPAAHYAVAGEGFGWQMGDAPVGTTHPWRYPPALPGMWEQSVGPHGGDFFVVSHEGAVVSRQGRRK
jgi:hypothetical protein